MKLLVGGKVTGWHYTPPPPPACAGNGHRYHPLNFPGAPRSVEASWWHCSERCRKQASCKYFSYWNDGSKGCHLSLASAKLVSAGSRVIAGQAGCEYQRRRRVESDLDHLPAPSPALRRLDDADFSLEEGEYLLDEDLEEDDDTDFSLEEGEYYLLDEGLEEQDDADLLEEGEYLLEVEDEP